FDPTGDVKVPVIDEPKIPGAQERTLARACDAGLEGFRVGLFAVPVALCDASAGNPDFPYLSRRAHLAGDFIYDPDRLAHRRATATHERVRVTRVGCHGTPPGELVFVDILASHHIARAGTGSGDHQCRFRQSIARPQRVAGESSRHE